MATTTTVERTRLNAEQLRRIRRMEAKSQKVLDDFLNANPEFKRYMEEHYREPAEHSHDPDDAAVWQGVILEAQAKTAAQEYYELFSSTYPRAAAIFYDEVIRLPGQWRIPVCPPGSE